MNETPMANRQHIAFFGKTNAGKSSVVNAVTGQGIAIVSEVKGTTTDPVFKTMELLPLGPIVIIDTPGLDDIGELGELRIKKTYQVLAKTDIAVVVIDSKAGVTDEDIKIINRINAYNIPFVIAFNKIDELQEYKDVVDGNLENDLNLTYVDNEIEKQINIIKNICGFDDKQKADSNFNVKFVKVSAKANQGIKELKETIGSFNKEESKQLLADVVKSGDFIVLVVPIDSAAPKGRLILPQQMVIRELLDIGATAIVVKDAEYKETLDRLGENNKPRLVITDSQVFGEISKLTSDEIYLTSFSIILARAKGDLDYVVKSANVIDELVENDMVLISEGCTHHRQCDDIGTVKIPNLIRKCTGKNINFEFTSGREFPEDLSKYKLIIHCGGCMLNDKEIKYRQKMAMQSGIAMTNYGIAIAHMKGILQRSVEVFLH